MIPNGDGTFRCSYVPTKPIKHTIIISWAGVNVPKSPFRVRLPLAPKSARFPASRPPRGRRPTGQAEAGGGELPGRLSLEPGSPAHR